jgi:single-stranded DNA-binding protein
MDGAMTIEAAFFGSIGKDPERKTSQAGRAYLRLNVRVGNGDGVQWVNVMAFNDVDDLADRLKKDSKVYIEGAITADAWIDRDGKARASLSAMTWRCVETHRIGRNKQKKEEPRAADGVVAGAEAQRRDDLPNDEIPF